MKSQSETAFYVPDGPADAGVERFVSTRATAGPWSPDAQHGGPPAALLGRAVERLLEPGRTVGRFTMDLLGPVPVGLLRVTSAVLRPGRSVTLLQAEMYDEHTDRLVARAQAWAFPLTTQGPRQDHDPLAHTHADGIHEEPPTTWNVDGYMDAMEWTWISGAVTRLGPAVVWMRPRVPLVPGEEMTGLQRLLVCVDSANGAAAAVDADRWSFLNTELTVNVLRPPVGEWVCLDARTTLGPGSIGFAASEVYDERGLVGRSTQTLLVVPGRG